MRIIAGVLVIIFAVFIAVIAIVTIASNMDTYLAMRVDLGFVRALPPLLILLSAIGIGFWGYRILKRTK